MVFDPISEQLITIGLALTSTRDLYKLLDLVLREARNITNADAGSVYLVQNESLFFETSQNQTLQNRFGEVASREFFQRKELPLNMRSIAGYVALTKEIVNIKDVYDIPEKYSFSFNDSWDKANNYHSKSMLVLPMLDQKEEVVGVLQLINAKDDTGETISFSKDFEHVLSAFASQAAVAIVNATLNSELREAHLDTVFRLGVAAEYRDKETANHIKRVSEFSVLMGREIGLDADDDEVLYWAAAMHDVGKLGIPDAILHKPGPLNQEERKIMEYHTIIGAQILKEASSPLLRQSRIVALTHHEKYDGKGYPQGLSKDTIPIMGRITAVADVFDALSTRRVYKPAFPMDKVLSIMNSEKGAHFDPELVEALLGSPDEVHRIQTEFADKEEDFDKFRNVTSLSANGLMS